AVVRAANALLGERKPGETVISLDDPAAGGATPGGEVTVLGILNDNMPFLLDSTLAELYAFGATIRLVAHPIVSVTRDRAGRLVAYHGAGPVPEGAIRESLIQIHLNRIEGAEPRRELVERLRSLFVEVRRAVADWPA